MDDNNTITDNSGNEVKKTAAESLKKSHISLSGSVFMIFCLVAAGAFGIEEMIPASGPGLTLILLLVFPFIWALPLSGMVAELGSLLPSEGGVYVWCRDALGEFWGWQVGYWSGAGTWLQQASYCALVAGYISKFAPLTPAEQYIVKIAMIIIFTVINLLGLEEVSAIDTIFSILVIVAFAAVTVVGFCNWHYDPFVPFINDSDGVVQSLGGSISIVIWMYCGYECLSNTAEEFENPQIIPKGLMVSQPIIAASYFLPTMAALASVGQWSKWSTESGGGHVGYMDVLIQNLGTWAGIAFLVVAIIANCSIFNSYITSGSRAFFVMADDHLFPPALCKVSKKRGVPALAIILMACFTIVLCQFSFTTLIMATTPLQLYIYMALSVTVLKLRKDYPVEERKKQGLYVIPGGKAGLYLMTIIPFIICILALYVNGTEYFLSGFVLLAIGLILYVIFKLIYKGRAADDSEKYPLNKKTKLTLGDTINIGVFVLLSGIVSFVGSVLLKLYEGGYGPEYYLSEYGHGLFSNFDLMLKFLQWGGIIMIIVGLAVWYIGRKTEGPQLKEHALRNGK